MELNVNDEKVKDLFQEHKEELSISELKELETMQHSVLLEGLSKETKKNRKQTRKYKTGK